MITTMVDETAQIESAIKAAHLPSHVAATPFELGLDAAGGEGVWIWVILADKAPRSAWKSESGMRIREQIQKALEGAGVSRWPYIMFRTQKEQAEIEAEERA